MVVVFYNEGKGVWGEDNSVDILASAIPRPHGPHGLDASIVSSLDLLLPSLLLR